MKADQNLTAIPREQTDVERMRIQTRCWLSDCEYMRLEVSFLRRLLTKVARWAVSAEEVVLLTDQVKNINNLELRRSLRERIIRGHLTQVEAVIRNPLVRDAEMIGDDNEDLKKGVSDFSQLFQKSRASLFEFIENLVDASKLHRLLASRNDVYSFEV